MAIKPARIIFWAVALLTITLLAGCVAPKPAPTTTAVDTPTPVVLPAITSAQLDSTQIVKFGSFGIKVALTAAYSNPYDARQVSLEATFLGPDGRQMKVPGYWDGESDWWVRFTPPEAGSWKYSLTVTDSRGSSLPIMGTFSVAPSSLHGWLQAGNWVDPAFSGHYLVYADGAPFYGVGHGDAFNMLADGFSLDRGVGLFNNMLAAGENYVVWWPLWSNSLISSSYDDYSLANMKVIDLVVKDAQKKGIYLIFTIWDHPLLRGEGHPWGDGNWAGNGFSKLTDLPSFFTSAEAWAWQENLYRYMIARWGYSPAIGMWQTVSEINGTNAYDQTDPWHTKVSAYFTANDPYRHPTTASMSGDVDWPAGFRVMDAPQVHVYDFKNGALDVDAVHAAQVLAQWTGSMWSQQDKPNWVGEFGVPGNSYYPELFHNSIWAALASGAAMTPAEWNDRGSWMQMSAEMYADNGRLAKFVADLPLAKLDPSPLQIASSDAQVRGWGLAGRVGGLFWVQDFSLEGKSIDAVRSGEARRKGVRIQVSGLAEGTYTIAPYDTWQGIYLQAFEITCTQGQACPIALPDFKADMAFKVIRK